MDVMKKIIATIALATIWGVLATAAYYTNEPDIQTFNKIWNKPYNMAFYPDPYESGSFGYEGPTIMNYPDHKEVIWGYWVNWKINQAYQSLGLKPPGWEAENGRT
jgi:hypothetical protein